MATALPVEDGEVGAPGAHRRAVPLGHHARDLRQVAEIVDHPRRQQFPQRDGPERGMRPAPCQIIAGERQLPKCREIRRPQSLERSEKIGHRATTGGTTVGNAVERLEALRRTVLQYPPDADHPIDPFPFDEMTRHVPGSERPGSFVGGDPSLGKVLQHDDGQRRRP
jgi:hypothetical protein